MKVVNNMHPLLMYSEHQEVRHTHNYHNSHNNQLGQDIDDVQMDIHDNGGNTKAEIRKSNKPVMEKRRRKRINDCLNDLKGILLEAMRKDPARHSKLEKADILELTVRHLQNVQRNQLAIAMATDPTVLLRFKNGFSECATEVGRYIGKLDGVDSGIRHRLSGHLGSCVNGLQQVGPFSGGGGPRYSTSTPTFGGISIALPSVKSNPDKITTSARDSSPGSNTGREVQVIPQPPNNTLNNQNPIEDFNNNNALPTQAQVASIATSVILNSNSHSEDLLSHHHPVPNPPNGGTFSAFTTVARRPPSPQESPLLMSPPSSNDNPNVSVSLSSGSDSSSCAGTTPNMGLNASPIDFSLKIKDKERTVRVLKVEPMMMYDDLNTSISKGSMWRPW